MDNTKLLFPDKEHKKLIDAVVTRLFLKAKKKDSAEYIAAIKYFSDMYSLHQKTPNQELRDTVIETYELMDKSIQGNIGIKLLAYLYCQIFESDNWLNLICNLLNILNSECADRQPFRKEITNELKMESLKKIENVFKSGSDLEKKIITIGQNMNQITNPYPTILSKIKKIKNISKKVDSEIGNLLQKLFKNDFRNDFVHSDYVLYKGHFNLIKANKNIKYEGLVEIMTSAIYLYISLAGKVFDEIGYMEKKGKVEYKGKHGFISMTINPDGTILHESRMLCANF